MASYTCLACQVVFTDGDVQRLHYKSDWHRYNLKRKVAELPPITEDVFKEKVITQSKKNESKKTMTSYGCQLCCKTFSTENSYKNHITSKKHMDIKIKAGSEKDEAKVVTKSKEHNQNASIQTTSMMPVSEHGSLPHTSADRAIEEIVGTGSDEDDDWEDVDSEEEDGDGELIDEDALPPEVCLFCPHQSIKIEDNLRHMTKSHSFFIPDMDYVTDLESFMCYLGAKVGSGKVCLLCSDRGKQFQSVRDCQKHMIDKGHCTLDYEGDASLEYSDFYDFTSSYPDVNESDSEESILDLIEVNGLKIDPETMELVLPSGARAGHRALQRYFKQNITPEHLKQSHRAAILDSCCGTVMGRQYSSIAQRQAAISGEIRIKMATKKIENRRQFKKDLHIAVKANKLQKFFRKQVMYAG